MSAPLYLSQRHLNLIPNSSVQTEKFGTRISIADRFSQLLHDIEAFLLACTYEEMCSFWNAIANLRHYLQASSNPSEMPQFLSGRRKKRNFNRILEVLADLTYPKMRPSQHLAKRSNERPTHFVQSNLATPR